MNVSMAETTADRFSVYMNLLRYVCSNVIAERSGLYQAVLWKFVEKRSKSGESVPWVSKTRFRTGNHRALVWKNGQMLPGHEVLT